MTNVIPFPNSEIKEVCSMIWETKNPNYVIKDIIRKFDRLANDCRWEAQKAHLNLQDNEYSIWCDRAEVVEQCLVIVRNLVEGR